MPFGSVEEERRSKCELISIINSFYTPAELQRIKWEKKKRKKKVKYIYHSLIFLLFFYSKALMSDKKYYLLSWPLKSMR